MSRTAGSPSHVTGSRSPVTSRARSIRAEACADDKYGALDVAMDKLLERLRRANDRRHVPHRGRHVPESVAQAHRAPGRRGRRRRRTGRRGGRGDGTIPADGRLADRGPHEGARDDADVAGPGALRDGARGPRLLPLPRQRQRSARAWSTGAGAGPTASSTSTSRRRRSDAASPRDGRDGGGGRTHRVSGGVPSGGQAPSLDPLEGRRFPARSTVTCHDDPVTMNGSSSAAQIDGAGRRTGGEPIRVLVADDHVLYRRGLRAGPRPGGRHRHHRRGR